MFYKGAVLFLILYVFRFSVNVIYPSIFIIIYFLFHFQFSKSLSYTFQGVYWAIQSYAIFLYFIFFRASFTRFEGRYFFKNMIFISFVFLVFNMLLGALGYGYYQYSFQGDFGVKGFIYSGNELSVLVFSLMFSALALCFYSKGWASFYFISLIGTSASILLSTKAAMLGAVVLLFSFFFIMIVGSSVSAKFVKVLVSSAVIIGGIGIFFVFFITDFWGRQLFLHDRYGFVNAIFSNRNDWAIEALRVYKDLMLSEKILGVGLAWRDLVSFNKPIEIDLVDYLLMYGVGGVCLVLLGLGYLCYHAVRLHLRSYFLVLYLIYIISLAGISVFAGHVFYSGVAGMSIAACFSLIYFFVEDHEDTRYI